MILAIDINWWIDVWTQRLKFLTVWFWVLEFPPEIQMQCDTYLHFLLEVQKSVLESDNQINIDPTLLFSEFLIDFYHVLFNQVFGSKNHEIFLNVRFAVFSIHQFEKSFEFVIEEPLLYVAVEQM